jgi:hypothetical protein
MVPCSQRTRDFHRHSIRESRLEMVHRGRVRELERRLDVIGDRCVMQKREQHDRCQKVSKILHHQFRFLFEFLGISDTAELQSDLMEALVDLCGGH